ncbi:MAG: replication-associated recombination protein A [Candidatus Kerfeldbacteria bacterium]|nr:replication-associated recombination protein A [Candidatus Kerfeldbacteria bacterium]
METNDTSIPLPERLRPQTFDEYVGQTHIVGADALLKTVLRSGSVPSMILWGPPGSGKTTLAHLLAKQVKAECVQMSAISSGKQELTKVIADAKQRKEFFKQNTILFVDEIHRWNKAQQDALLSAVEKGVITFIGATTENPSFEVNNALLSRCQVIVLKSLTEKELDVIARRAEKTINFTLPDDVRSHVVGLSNGDARVMLNMVDVLSKATIKLTLENVRTLLQKTLQYDRHAEEHYNTISALHKSMRASDPTASVYWLARMLEAGEDPLYVARRVIRFASEDIGNAKPNALVLAVAAYQACHMLGMPECNLALTQAVEYCASAPKSRAMDTAYVRAKKDIIDRPQGAIPMHLRNAPTQLMKELGYGKREQDSNMPQGLEDRNYFSD